ncbi:hypothetical protein JCM19238_1253 [Vibrio ponticus]|nr:hypothetical protein JCM19238_1253 [Vibrio ponticus]
MGAAQKCVTLFCLIESKMASAAHDASSRLRPQQLQSTKENTNRCSETSAMSKGRQGEIPCPMT